MGTEEVGRRSTAASRTGLILLLLTAANLAVFGRTVAFEFVAYDDPGYVLNHPVVPAGLSAEGVRWVFANDHKGLWAPVTWLSYMLDAQLGGLEPALFHATNVLLHMVNTALLYLLLERLTGAAWRSALVAALFALHPLHVEPVAWVASRKDLLSATFGLASMLAYVRYARRGSRATYLVALLSFLLGLLAKPMLVTLPFVLLLLDRWPLGRLDARNAARRAVEKVPFLALSAAVSVVAYLAQAAGGSLSSGGELPLAHRLSNAVVSYVRYLGMTVWPADLTVLYPHPYMGNGGGYGPWRIGGAALLLAAITLLSLRARSRGWATMGWLWYIGTLVPVIGLVQFGRQALADRFTYLPSIGLFVVVAWGGAELAARAPRLARTMKVAAVLWVGLLACLSWRQTGTWRDSRTLFEHAVTAEPNSATMYNNLASELVRVGDRAGAIRHLERAVELQPTYGRAHLNLAKLLHEERELGRAIEHYRAALRTREEELVADASDGLRRARAERAAGGEESP